MTVTAPYHECPSFDVCSCQKCPLDPLIDKRISLSDDEKCRAHKPTRNRIGRKYPELLPYQGLTVREWQGRQNWDSKSPEEKAKFVEVSTKRLSSARLAIKNN